MRASGARRFEVLDAARGERTWRARMDADRARAHRNQTPAQRHITETVVSRALHAGAESVALTGSTARARRWSLSDLDIHVVGPRPRFTDLDEGVDIYATSGQELWRRLHEGDDFIQWTLRFGCILVDGGIFRDAARYVAETDLWPSPARKLARAQTQLDFAEKLVETGDLEASQEQVRAALTCVTRWLLLSQRVFPLARDELSDQALQLGHFDLAAALHRSLHSDPDLSELAHALEIANGLLAIPPRPALA